MASLKNVQGKSLVADVGPALKNLVSGVKEEIKKKKERDRKKKLGELSKKALKRGPKGATFK